jgi:hypothetical protein
MMIYGCLWTLHDFGWPQKTKEEWCHVSQHVGMKREQPLEPFRSSLKGNAKIWVKSGFYRAKCQFHFSGPWASIHFKRSARFLFIQSEMDPRQCVCSTIRVAIVGRWWTEVCGFVQEFEGDVVTWMMLSDHLPWVRDVHITNSPESSRWHISTMVCVSLPLT